MLNVIIQLFIFIIVLIVTILGATWLINWLQILLFVPDDAVLWTFEAPGIYLIFVFQFVVTIPLLYSYFFIEKKMRKDLWHSYKKKLLIGVSVVGLLFWYAALTSITVITDRTITHHSMLQPFGKDYAFTDISSIETGVYGRSSGIIMKQHKGEFYYILELSDGTKVHTHQAGNIGEMENPFFTIEELDQVWVELGTTKKTSMDDFELTQDHLAEIYTDAIYKILTNTKD